MNFGKYVNRLPKSLPEDQSRALSDIHRDLVDDLGYFKADASGARKRPIGDKLNDFVSVKDFGAQGDGSTDDTTAIANAFLASLNVYFPPGTYISGQLSLRSGHYIVGAGIGVSSIVHRSGTNGFCLYGTSVNNVCIAYLTLNGNSAGNTSGGMGVRIDGTSADIRIEDCRIQDFRLDGISADGTGSRVIVARCNVSSNLRDGVSISGFSGSRVVDCDANLNTRYGVLFGPLSNDSSVVACSANSNGESGLTASGFGSSLNNIKFVGNFCNSNTQYGINSVTVVNVTYENNTATSNGVDGFGVTLTSPFACIFGNRASNNGRVGISVDSEAHFSVVYGNHCLSNGWEGIGVFRSTDVTVDANIVLNNGTREAVDPDPAGVNHEVGILVYDTAAAPNEVPSNRCRIVNNTIMDTGGNSQKYGVRFLDASGNSTGAWILANHISGHSTANVSGISGNLFRVRDNSGYVTQNEGTSAIASGTTSITINHGLSTTPTAEDFDLTFTNSATNDPGQVWISGITSTQFTVNCRNNPGASGANFSWKVSVY